MPGLLYQLDEVASSGEDYTGKEDREDPYSSLKLFGLVNLTLVSYLASAYFAKALPINMRRNAKGG